MNTVSVVVKLKNQLTSVRIEKNNLDKLITNLKLYQKDITFINEFIAEYYVSQNPDFLPTANGIIFIDLVDDIILDSQKVTAINKIAPSELKMESSLSAMSRFRELVEAGYLKGFQTWQDNGNHLNKEVLKMSVDELVEFALKTNSYGQFVFSTTPFKVEHYNLLDWVDQTQLLKKLIELDLVPIGDYRVWKQHLEGLK